MKYVVYFHCPFRYRKMHCLFKLRIDFEKRKNEKQKQTIEFRQMAN